MFEICCTAFLGFISSGTQSPKAKVWLWSDADDQIESRALGSVGGQYPLGILNLKIWGQHMRSGMKGS